MSGPAFKVAASSQSGRSYHSGSYGPPPVKYRWQPWFAWRPVKTISGRRVWWCQIYRSQGNGYVDYDNWAWYHYGDEFDMLRHS